MGTGSKVRSMWLPDAPLVPGLDLEIEGRSLKMTSMASCAPHRGHRLPVTRGVQIQTVTTVGGLWRTVTKPASLMHPLPFGQCPPPRSPKPGPAPSARVGLPFPQCGRSACLGQEGQAGPGLGLDLSHTQRGPGELVTSYKRPSLSFLESCGLFSHLPFHFIFRSCHVRARKARAPAPGISKALILPLVLSDSSHSLCLACICLISCHFSLINSALVWILPSPGAE